VVSAAGDGEAIKAATTNLHRRVMAGA